MPRIGKIPEDSFGKNIPIGFNRVKEANETEYWILLLQKSGYISQEVAKEHTANNRELTSILVASIETAKKSLNK